jgi:acetyl-CoA C-acetyltransferase
MREAVIVSAVRTPVGRVRGALAPVPAEDLGALVVKEAVKRSTVAPADIDEVVFSNLMNTNINNMARMVGLAAGLPLEVPGITVDRQCGASLNAFAYAAILIEAGYADVVVAGGVESDSRRNYVMDKPTEPFQVMPPQWSEVCVVPAEYGRDSMVDTAENIAADFGISRAECDQFAALSHDKAARAWDAGYFDEQVVPVEVKLRKSTQIVSKDEPVRPGTTVEILSKLRPVKGEGGIVTAGNSSPMSDGAGALVVMEKEKAKAMRLHVLGRFRAYAAAGVEPRIMGIGPVYATRKLMRKTGMSLDDMDLVEMNEAFAAQSLACIRELGVDIERLNVNGGAIALGHPLAGTGAILVTKMVHELQRRDAGTGLITFCCGGGQGVSVVIERE